MYSLPAIILILVQYNTLYVSVFVCPLLGSEPMETLEDIYIGSIETDRGTREQVRFYDTRGLRDGMEFPRHYYTFADGFVLVYSIDSKESFKRMEALKKDIDRHRDKKEVRLPTCLSLLMKRSTLMWTELEFTLMWG